MLGLRGLRPLVFHDLERGPLAVTRRRRAEQVANGNDRLPMLSDDLADVALAKLET